MNPQSIGEIGVVRERKLIIQGIVSLLRRCRSIFGASTALRGRLIEPRMPAKARLNIMLNFIKTFSMFC